MKKIKNKKSKSHIVKLKFADEKNNNFLIIKCFILTNNGFPVFDVTSGGKTFSSFSTRKKDLIKIAKILEMKISKCELRIEKIKILK